MPASTSFSVVRRALLPDGGPLLGEAPELKNFFVAAGLNSLGILQGGGVGKIMAQWIVDGYCPVESHHIDIARCFPFQGTQKYLTDRTVETLGLQYQADLSQLLPIRVLGMSEGQPFMN